MGLGASGNLLKLRLFLQGIEVPVIAAQVQLNVNAPATAAIQVIPSDRIPELKPRTMVHLFFWDYTKDLPDASDTQNSATEAGTPGPLSNFRMLFGGELMGFEMVKSQGGQQAVLKCADFSTYWDTCYQIFISYSKNGNFLTESSAIWAGGNTMFDDILDGHSSVLNSFLKKTPKSDGLQDVKGLNGGIISLLEAMGGVVNHTQGVNDFFTVGEMMTHLMQQIMAEQDDDTAQRLFDGKAFEEWLNRGVTSLGELVTFRDMMKLLFKWIYYEVVPNPTPRYIRGEQSKSTLKTVTTRSDSLSKSYRDKLAELRQEALTRSRAFIPASTDVTTATAMAATLTGIVNDSGTPARVVKKLKVAVIELEAIRPIDLSNNGPVSPALSNTTLATAGIAGFKANWAAASLAMSGALAISGASLSTRTKVEKTKPKLDRLPMQIFRPDCFFVAPPRCNVLFPEQYNQYTFSRNFMQEITRLRLQTSWFAGADSGLLASFFFAPATKDIIELAKKQGASGVRALLPWEKFTGIIPKVEHIAEINYIANKAERKLKQNVRGQADSFSQRAANFNFYKFRFAARSMEVSAKFNPFMVIGFPALVITRPFTVNPDDIPAVLQKAVSGGNTGVLNAGDILGNLRVFARELGAPTQFLGMVAGLGHNVDQRGGFTSATLTHARTHRITDDDFLNIYSKEVTKDASKRIIQTTLVADDLIKSGDYKQLKILRDITPQNPQEQMELKAKADAQAKLDAAKGFGGVGLSKRPNGAPDPTQVGALAPFTILNPNLQSLVPSNAIQVTGFLDGTPLRAGTQQTVLKGTRTQILEPNPPGILKVGGRGPKGGTIVQIQLFSDSIVAVSPQDLVAATDTDKLKKEKLKAAGKAGFAKGSFFLWRKAIVHEEVQGKTLERTIPIEESIRPPWFSPLYSNFFIGDRIYQPFFGTGSLVDEATFTTSSGAVATFGGKAANQQALLAQLQAADGDMKKMAQILDDARKGDKKTLADVPDVEVAADALAFIYGETRRLDLDVNRFVNDYTSRPIATLEDVLGSADLVYAKDATGKKLTLVSGTPGFHSSTIADFGDLLGLVDNPDQALPRIREQGKKVPISKNIDPRPERRQRVLAYANELGGGRGALGVGLAG